MEGSWGQDSASVRTQEACHPIGQAPDPIRPASLLDCVPHYVEIGDLGRGNFGLVLRALDTRPTSQSPEVAIKMLPRGEFIRNYKTYVKREIVHQSSLRHPSIIRLREVFMTPTHIGVVMDCANGGDLHAYITRRPAMRLCEEEARWFFQQLVVGLDYCHSRGVANRDLKLENLLLDSADSPRPILKMCDFGYSKHELNSLPKTSVGTTCYMAPEVYLGYTTYDAKVADIWSLGIILFAMLFGAFPFKGRDKRYIQAVLLGRYAIPPDVQVSSGVMHLLSLMLVPEPSCRCELSAIIHHPWFLQDLPAGAFEMNARLLAEKLQLEDVPYRVNRLVDMAQRLGDAREPVTFVRL
ncbi:SNRK2F [Auxenochlorella protothecoides x Auxenochlorella symbiontica]